MLVISLITLWMPKLIYAVEVPYDENSSFHNHNEAVGSFHNMSAKSPSKGYSAGFINEDPDGITCQTSSNFEDYDKAEVNHGFFVSTCQLANTFFHQIETPRKVFLHSNKINVGHYTDHPALPRMKIMPTKDCRERSSSLLSKFKAFARDKFVDSRFLLRSRMRYYSWLFNGGKKNTSFSVAAILFSHFPSRQAANFQVGQVGMHKGEEDDCHYKRNSRKMSCVY